VTPVDGDVQSSGRDASAAAPPSGIYSPYDHLLAAEPYETFRILRDDFPLYVDEELGFFALSRHADVESGLRNVQSYSSSRGNVLEIIQAGFDMPSGTVIYEDPPLHTIHRSLLSRVFTPKRMSALEDDMRAICASCLDPLVGAGGFDFVEDLAKPVAMRTIGLLLGIPDADQRAVRDRPEADMSNVDGRPMKVSKDFAAGDAFAEYVEWRAEHPADDLMTMLLQAEFRDERGDTRRLERSEVLTFVNVLAGAGNETSTHLIGWAGKVLGDHPDQLDELAADASLIPGAIEELLRFEPPAPYAARVATTDVEWHGHVVPTGSAVVFLIGAANHDPRRYDDADSFDIHREVGAHLAFGFGAHYCLGAALARMEGRVALQEVLRRFPQWEVDDSRAVRSPSSTVRGWASLPVTTA
jgi:cytochrome P450